MRRSNPAIAARHAAARALQDKRRDQLAQLRCQRQLTEEEQAEDERLAASLAMRVWRDQQREAETRLKETAR